MRRIAMMIAIVLVLAGWQKAYAFDGTPYVFGDVGLRGSIVNSEGSTLNALDASYMLGVKGEFDWLDYQVAFNNDGGLTNTNFRRLVDNAGGFADPIAVALARAKFTVHVLEVLKLHFGRFENPLLIDGFEFIWDKDRAITGLAQSVSIDNFFVDLVWHLDSVGALTGSTAEGSTLSKTATIMIAADAGYVFDFDSASLMVRGDFYHAQYRPEVGLNMALNLDVNEGYPIMLWLGGSMGLYSAKGRLSTMLRAQYGDLSMDETFAIGLNAAMWGQGSIINTTGIRPVAQMQPFASDRLTRQTVLLNQPTVVADNSYIINIGVDGWYRFTNWFTIGLEADYGFLGNAVAGAPGNAKRQLYTGFLAKLCF